MCNLINRKAFLLIITLVLSSSSFTLKAGLFQVTNDSVIDPPMPGSLADAIENINTTPSTYDQITFSEAFDIDLLDNVPLPTFSVPPVVPITILGISGLNIHQGASENQIFNAGTSTLHFIGNDNGGESNWGGSIASNAAMLTFEQASSSTYRGILSGTTALTYTGAGQSLTLTNSSTYTGPSFINDTTVIVGVDNALPPGGVVNIDNNGILEIADDCSQTVDRLNGTGLVTLGDHSTLILNPALDSTFAGSINSVPLTAGTLVKQNTTTLTLTNANTYEGNTNILAGTLKVDFNNALPQTNTVTIEAATSLEIASNRAQTLQSIGGTGNILIRDNAALTLNTITDAAFAGNINAEGAGVFIKAGTDALSLSGMNTGNLRLADNGGSVKILTGSTWDGPIQIEAATLELNGGTVLQAITGNALPSSNIDITGLFSPRAAITDVGLINVRPGGTLMLTQDLISVGANLLNTGLINTGVISHTDNSVRYISGNFTQGASGTLNIGISSPQQYSQLHIGGQTEFIGGTINAIVSSPVLIQNGNVFDIIISDGGIISTQLPTVSSSSLSLSFRPLINGNIFQLIANRKAFRFINHIPAYNGVATGLDNLSLSNPSSPVIRFLDGISSQGEFDELLAELAPTGLNGMYTVTGFGAIDAILLRLDTLRDTNQDTAFSKTAFRNTGYAAGDMMEDRDTAGPLVFGNSAKQSKRAGVPGYRVSTQGIGLVRDFSVLKNYRIGLGLTYANSKVEDSGWASNHTAIGNTQGLVYGSATYDVLFADAVLSGGINHYNGNRNILLLRESVHAKYKGFQYSAKLKAGCTLACDPFEISPIASIYYLALNVNRYVEKGAPNLNLSVAPMRISAVRACFGGRIANISQEEYFFPEVHAYYISDIKNPNAIITSQFTAGGGAFISRGVKPAKNGVNVGGSISSLMTENLLLSGHYDFEAKTSFQSHSFGFKFKYLF